LRTIRRQLFCVCGRSLREDRRSEGTRRSAALDAFIAIQSLPMASSNEFRFSAGTPKAHGAIWRLWVSKSDVYFSARATASRQKVSLHERDWRFAFCSSADPLLSKGSDRVIDTWKTPAWRDHGLVRACQVFVHTTEIRAPVEPLSQKVAGKICWVPAPPNIEMVRFTVWLVRQDVTVSLPVPNPTSLKVLAEFTTACSDRVAVTAEESPESEDDRRTLENLRRRLVALPVYQTAKARDPRAFLYKKDQGGCRLFVDVALPLRKGPTSTESR